MKKWQAFQTVLHQSPMSDSLERPLCPIDLSVMVEGGFHRLRKPLLAPYLDLHTIVARLAVASIEFAHLYRI